MNTDTPQPAFQGRTETTDAWSKPLGWDFGHDGTALMALRGCLERDDNSFQIGRHTLYDALYEVRALKQERDTLTTQLREMRSAARQVVEACNAWADSPAWGGEVMENMTEAIGELGDRMAGRCSSVREDGD